VCFLGTAARDSFNIYRLYVRLKGDREAPCALAAWISALERELARLASTLAPDLAAAFAARCRRAMAAAGTGVLGLLCA